jgi:hypothetical protein
MRRSNPRLFRRTQRGIAAVEMALVLPILVVLLSAPLFLGRIFWHYAAAQKAAHDAVRYLSAASRSEMRTNQLVAGEPPVVAVARYIVAQETAQLNPGPDQLSTLVECDDENCDGLAVPAVVRVRVRMRMYDLIFGSFTARTLPGLDAAMLTADVRMRYVGD